MTGTSVIQKMMVQKSCQLFRAAAKWLLDVLNKNRNIQRANHSFRRIFFYNALVPNIILGIIKTE